MGGKPFSIMPEHNRVTARLGLVTMQRYADRAEQVGAAIGHQRLMNRAIDQAGNFGMSNRLGKSDDLINAIFGPKCSQFVCHAGIGKRAIAGDQFADRLAIFQLAQASIKNFQFAQGSFRSYQVIEGKRP